MPAETSFTLAAAVRVLGPLITSSLGKLAKAGHDKIKHRGISNVTKNLWKRSNEFRKVFTFINLERPLDIFSFYCPAKILIDKKKVIVKDTASIPSKHTLIEGIAGQGKTILIRYLFMTELMRGENIPIFIELRNVRQNESIKSHCIQFLSSIGISISEQAFLWLQESNSVSIFLDGFDEVEESQRPQLIEEIEVLCRRFANMTIMVSSRPNSDIQTSISLRNTKICDLDRDDIKKLIHKIINDKSAEQMISAIEGSPSDISSLIQTPLMVTLLVVTYRSFQKIPNQLSEFYDDLFSMLLSRHDGVKKGYARPRKSRLNNSEFRRLFEATCLKVKDYRFGNYKKKQLTDAAEVAMKYENISADSEKFIDDIVNITCLILKDGNEYRFIHKSIMEYYCASFISRSDEESSKRFYDLALARHSRNSSQELKFLLEIDRQRFLKFFEIPKILKYLKSTEATIHGYSCPTLDDIDGLSYYVDGLRLSFYKKKSTLHSSSMSMSSGMTAYPIVMAFTFTVFMTPLSALHKEILKGTLPFTTPNETHPEEAHEAIEKFEVSIADAVRVNAEVREHIHKLVKETTGNLKNAAIAYLSELDNRKSAISMFDSITSKE